MSNSTGFQSYGLIMSLAQQVLYRRAHLANVITGMTDPKEYHTTALMSQILSRNIFTEDYFAVLAEQPPSPISRKSVDIVVSYVTNDGMDLRILCICECKRTKTTQEWSLAALETQALDYGCIYLEDTGTNFVYTAAMAGCRMRLWKCEDGGDKHLFTPFWGTNTLGDWSEYIDVGGHYGDVERITKAFNHMKVTPPTTRYGQTEESYGTQDFAAEHNDVYNAGQSSYPNLPSDAYDEPVTIDDQPAPNHRQNNVETVALTRIPHTFKDDEFQFMDTKSNTRTTHRSDWTKGQYDGRHGYWYQGRKTDYFTRYKF